MFFDVISEKSKVPLLFYSLERKSSLESTVAAFRTRNVKGLLRKNVKLDFKAEWKVVSDEKCTLTVTSSSSKLVKIASNVTTTKDKTDQVFTWEYCGNREHTV